MSRTRRSAAASPPPSDVDEPSDDDLGLEDGGVVDEGDADEGDLEGDEADEEDEALGLAGSGGEEDDVDPLARLDAYLSADEEEPAGGEADEEDEALGLAGSGGEEVEEEEEIKEPETPKAPAKVTAPPPPPPRRTAAGPPPPAPKAAAAAPPVPRPSSGAPKAPAPPVARPSSGTTTSAPKAPAPPPPVSRPSSGTATAAAPKAVAPPRLSRPIETKLEPVGADVAEEEDDEWTDEMALEAGPSTHSTTTPAYMRPRASRFTSTRGAASAKAEITTPLTVPSAPAPGELPRYTRLRDQLTAAFTEQTGDAATADSLAQVAMSRLRYGSRYAGRTENAVDQLLDALPAGTKA